MGSEWREGRLGDFIELHRGYDLPQQDRRPGRIPLVSSSGISDHLAAAMIDGPGVVTGRYGTIGQVFYLDEPFWPLNTTLYVSDFKGNDPRFASYLLRTVDFLAFSDKAAVPGVNRNHIHEAIIRWPVSIDEQKRIAGILGALDDKIDLNRRMSQTLESMARALFKSWFVDFDPVRARAEGRDTGLLPHTANLFPDSLDASDMGPVPRGWSIGALSDVAMEWRRSVRPADLDPKTPYVGLEHMPRHSITVPDWGTSDQVESGKLAFRRGDILFGKLRPYFHKVAVAPIDGVCSTDIVTLGPKTQKWFGFVLGHVASDAFVEAATAQSTGTKMPRTNWADMARYRVALPDDRVADAYSREAAALVSRAVDSAHECHALTAIRDSLLPPLMSGGLRANSLDGQRRR